MIATAPLTPDRTALLLIDAQEEHFIPGGPNELPDGEAALGEAAGLLQRARRVGAHVVHVRHIGEDPVFDDFRPGAPGFDFRPEVSPAEGEAVIDKRAGGAFDGTTLEDRLAELGVDAVVVAGFTSCGGCTATAREALGRRLRTVIAADATAAAAHGGVLPADAHDRALTAQRRFGAEVLSAATIRSLLEEGE
ncbi:MAG TPA: isochorismatase family protein [Miltoncostaea sp.]|nr:isochorismatase family protein [Miltoncostaea sp.]